MGQLIPERAPTAAFAINELYAALMNEFGVEGFEPPNVCTKNRCLNQTWRYPKISTNHIARE